jgi:hypothetical protein
MIRLADELDERGVLQVIPAFGASGFGHSIHSQSGWRR